MNAQIVCCCFCKLHNSSVSPFVIEELLRLGHVLLSGRTVLRSQDIFCALVLLFGTRTPSSAQNCTALSCAKEEIPLLCFSERLAKITTNQLWTTMVYDFYSCCSISH